MFSTIFVGNLILIILIIINILINVLNNLFVFISIHPYNLLEKLHFLPKLHLNYFKEWQCRELVNTCTFVDKIYVLEFMPCGLSPTIVSLLFIENKRKIWFLSFSAINEIRNIHWPFPALGLIISIWQAYKSEIIIKN